MEVFFTVVIKKRDFDVITLPYFLGVGFSLVGGLGVPLHYPKNLRPITVSNMISNLRKWHKSDVDNCCSQLYLNILRLPEWKIFWINGSISFNWWKYRLVRRYLESGKLALISKNWKHISHHLLYMIILKKLLFIFLNVPSIKITNWKSGL